MSDRELKQIWGDLRPVAPFTKVREMLCRPGFPQEIWVLAQRPLYWGMLCSGDSKLLVNLGGTWKAETLWRSLLDSSQPVSSRAALGEGELGEDPEAGGQESAGAGIRET